MSTVPSCLGNGVTLLKAPRQGNSDESALAWFCLSRQLCEALGWKQANGALRDMVCRGLLLMLDARKTPCSRAASAAAAHNTSGIGKRALCPFRQHSKRRQTLRMPTGISTAS